MIEELIADIASQGILGILLAVVLYAYWRKDCECSEIQKARLNDMREVKDQYTNLITEINSTLDRLVGEVSTNG